MLTLANAAGGPTWLFPLVFAGFVALSVIGSIVVRSIVSRKMAQWLAEFPAQPIAPDAQWRNPGEISIDGTNGNAYRFAMDQDHLHIVPVLPMRLILSMPTRSVPWSQIEVTRIDGDRATALFGGRAYVGPAWAVERAANASAAA